VLHAYHARPLACQYRAGATTWPLVEYTADATISGSELVAMSNDFTTGIIVNAACCSGSNYLIYRSIDGGLTWTATNAATGTLTAWNSLWVSDNGNVMAAAQTFGSTSAGEPRPHRPH